MKLEIFVLLKICLPVKSISLFAPMSNAISTLPQQLWIIPHQPCDKGMRISGFQSKI